MYYVNESSELFFEPSEEVIDKFGLTEISKEEFETLWSDSLIKETNLDLLAKTLRDNTVSSDLLVEALNNSVFQCTNEARDIKDVIFEAEASGALEEDTVSFRLADNSWKEVSLSDLRLVLSTFITRKREVWKQFSIWDQGGKGEPFDVVFENQSVETDI